jgi:hypothetical protein
MARMTPRVDADGLTLADHVRQAYNPLRVPNKHWGFDLYNQQPTPASIQAIHSQLPAPAERRELARQKPDLIAKLYLFCPPARSPEGAFQRRDFLSLVPAPDLARFDFPLWDGDSADGLVMVRAQWWIEWGLALRSSERAWIRKHAPHLEPGK